jgi:hypothetical protein
MTGAVLGRENFTGKIGLYDRYGKTPVYVLAVRRKTLQVPAVPSGTFENVGRLLRGGIRRLVCRKSSEG